MRKVTAIKHLESSLIGKRRVWLEFNRGECVADATHMYTFDNGLTLFLMENLSFENSNMILVDRSGAVSVAQGQPEFTLRPEATR